MTLLGMPRSTLDASVILDTVDLIALKRNVLLELMFLVELVLSKGVIVPDVVSAITLKVFANATKDTLETGASTRPFWREEQGKD
jgi:hypothetical protein